MSRNMKNIRIFLSENFHFLVVKFSICLNRHVFVMIEYCTVGLKPRCEDMYLLSWAPKKD